MPADYLDLRALNRATLSRQLLLRRSALTPAQAVAHLAGLQAQAPRAPYVGLQARLASFRPEHLENLLNERGVLRAHLMRNTVHLLTAADRDAIAAEGERLLDFVRPVRAAEDARDVRFVWDGE